jgi:hypothetical protein
LATSLPTADLWDTIALEAEQESPLWREALLEPGARERVPVFSPLGQPRFELGIETIYEGYLLHYGRPRLFAPETAERALLLGDYLYAHGLVRVAAEGDVGHVSDLAELISLCAQLRADGGAGEDWAWASTVALLGSRSLAQARAALRERGDVEPLGALARDAAGDDAVERARTAHAARVR